MRLVDSRRLTIQARPHDLDTIRVFARGYLVGSYAEGRRDGRLVYLPEVVAPHGEHYQLPPCDSSVEAITAVLTAASEYEYQPHPITVTSGDHLPDRQCYEVWCPTCHHADLPATPPYPSRVEAWGRAAHDHYEITGHPAVLCENPTPLLTVGPPSDHLSPHPHGMGFCPANR
ncbi:hypothetical protein LX15_000197 [Streptoalloteichus tenebrarius]|uniref:Uncharacterized protein n=1 Tax=Streptoalloteichus tenebrarius (strain ATCC 17920 / DSM 40477 / JCM 4838 / CBS 697.72 / NBRC 16177 / NCIMB 11028 / NRRL B-12390 / A12253. 1 / ISP 5477) TaxID=1933 RepID=A0ABT1HLX0_STRSD|nr:hypothetical protein [Streptoalloteichus tenebrarius]MCP2256514.1 hypothetical protein [Streptoalloteichus tenebrarius]BFF04865.1 hypothetical protein GCM10020241_65400 [Streptoalloteichus tenebrarius]